MRKLILFSFLTLDGVMQAPGGSNEDTEGGFKHGGWQMRYEGDDTVIQAMGKMGALLLGRKTYDIFSSYWPTEGKNIEPIGPIMNSLPKYVASKTLKKVDWQNSTLLKGDLVEAVNEIKKESGKDIYMFGSGDLCQSLMRSKLIDEFLLMVHPLTLGEGKQLFRQNGLQQELELAKSHLTKSGILVLNYKVKK